MSPINTTFRNAQNTANLGLMALCLVAGTSALLLFTSTVALSQEQPQFPATETQSVDLPTVQEIEAELSQLDGFMMQLRPYVSEVNRLTEDYRSYVQSVNRVLATCEGNEYVSTLEPSGFTGLMIADAAQCADWLVDWVEDARVVARRQIEILAVAKEYQQTLQKLGENISKQQDRLSMLMQARRLNDIVEQGFKDVESSQQRFAPSKDKGVSNRRPPGYNQDKTEGM